MEALKKTVYLFKKTLKKCLDAKSLIVYALSGAITYLLVVNDVDFKYLEYFKNTTTASILFSAAAIGGIVPFIIPILLLLKKHKATIPVIIGEVLGSIISSTLKAFTGRIHPPIYHGLYKGTDTLVNTIESSKTFHFGFFREGIFWGWPSSHTTIAFAMSIIMMHFYKKPWQRSIAAFYMIFIGIGVSMTIHWFSDFVAGAIIGTNIAVATIASIKTSNNKKHLE